jgi:hypothetical protein
VLLFGAMLMKKANGGFQKYQLVGILWVQVRKRLPISATSKMPACVLESRDRSRRVDFRDGDWSNWHGISDRDLPRVFSRLYIAVLGQQTRRHEIKTGTATIDGMTV